MHDCQRAKSELTSGCVKLCFNRMRFRSEVNSLTPNLSPKNVWIGELVDGFAVWCRHAAPVRPKSTLARMPIENQFPEGSC